MAAKPVTAETPTLWMVVADTIPNTALQFRREFGRWPAKVLVTDWITRVPIVWVADDNGGEGFGNAEEARVAGLGIEHDPSVMLTVRPMSRAYRYGGDFMETH